MNTTHGQPISNHHRNERPGLNQPFHERPYTPGPPEEVLDSTKVEIERKTYLVKRCKNVRGEFMRIIEEGINTPRKNAIIIPLTGLPDFIKALQSVGKVPAS